MKAKRIYQNTRILPGTFCACGCGHEIPTHYQSGRARYNRFDTMYIRGHSWPHNYGSANPAWKGGRFVGKAGYCFVYQPNHPNSNKKGYVFEHRLVWERANGRLLQPQERVHHINGDGLDNRPENLVALTQSQHSRLHGKYRDMSNMATPESCRRGGIATCAKRYPKHL